MLKDNGGINEMTTHYITKMDPFGGGMPVDKEIGKEKADEYATGRPFPHVVIDDFLPENLARMAIDLFPIDHDAKIYNRPQERLKRCIFPDSPWHRVFFNAAFNSLAFITVIENITGIKGLIGDPYFLGGGYHEIKTGGYLSMHADFNHHPKLNLERRVNVLIYLNPGWKESYGGQLELWDTDDRGNMGKLVKSIVPIMNRCVIFNTTNDSWHGNPNPVNHPEGKPRRSIALYYYTATWNDSKKKLSTVFKQRKGSGDRFDYKQAAVNLAKDWLPPAIYRRLAR
jgi:hypothetical protein